MTEPIEIELLPMTPILGTVEATNRYNTCCEALGGLLGLPPGADLPTELPKAVADLIRSRDAWRDAKLNG